jgi:hypothetical protein
MNSHIKSAGALVLTAALAADEFRITVPPGQAAVQRIAPGQSATLVLSAHTVHRHVANTLTKLNVSSRSAAVAQAARLGLL